MNNESRPTIDFPCDYPIKVMGVHEGDFTELVLEIVERHAPGLSEERISYRQSRNGRYLSIQVVITATGPDQLQALFDELKASGRVAMVL